MGVGVVSHVGDSFVSIRRICCVAQRCVRRWEPGVSKIGEYTGYCPRPQVMVLLFTVVTWCQQLSLAIIIIIRNACHWSSEGGPY